MPQITFPYGDAEKALHEFLHGGDTFDSCGRRWSRNIAGDGGDGLVAVIVDPGYLRELQTAAAAWRHHLQPKASAGLPDGYRPFEHAPTVAEDRAMPTGPLEDALAQAFYGSQVGELGQEQRDLVHAAAWTCLWRATWDADDTGAVPVLMRSHQAQERDEPEPRMLWQIAYKTGVRGLFLRASANGFFGEEWAVVTARGFKLASGWWTREAADRAVAAVGRVLPQVDWADVDSGGVFTEDALAALKQVFRRYRDNVDPAVEEPEPVADATRPLPGRG
jgi:hypothetical protein